MRQGASYGDPRSKEEDNEPVHLADGERPEDRRDHDPRRRQPPLRGGRPRRPPAPAPQASWLVHQGILMIRTPSEPAAHGGRPARSAAHSRQAPPDSAMAIAIAATTLG